MTKTDQQKRYWLSWNEYSEDHRPLTYPPNEAILGWWCSGEGDGYSTLCALVKATHENAAWRAVKKDWPQRIFEIRFCDEVEKGFDPRKGGRFMTEKWMEKRI
jgi:hypothetical protein